MKDAQTLYLLRHARAEPWSPGLDDLERCLEDRGKAHMKKLATWAAKSLESPETTLCSPAARTRQTLEQLQGHWVDSASDVTFNSELYEATTGQLQSLVESTFVSTRRLLVIGHNPGLEYLAKLLADESSQKNADRMTMGTLAVIEFPGGWESAGGTGVLRHWLGSDDLD